MELHVILPKLDECELKRWVSLDERVEALRATELAEICNVQAPEVVLRRIAAVVSDQNH